MRSLEFYCNNEMECEFVSKRETRKCGKVAEKNRRRAKWYDLYLYDGMMEVRNAESVAIMRWNMSCLAKPLKSCSQVAGGTNVGRRSEVVLRPRCVIVGWVNSESTERPMNGSLAAMHTGAGVARRDAYHERRANERAQLQERDEDGLLRSEQQGAALVRVAADTVVVETEGPNYTPKVKRESKKERRARQQQRAREQQERQDVGDGKASESGSMENARALPPAGSPTVGLGGTTASCSTEVQSVSLCDAFEDEEDEGELGSTAAPTAPLLDAHGPSLSEALRYLRRRLTEYLCKQAKQRKPVVLIHGSSGGLYPSMQWTIQFGKWLASSRLIESKASRWEEKAWKDAYQQRKTKGEKSYYVMLQHIKNHLWSEVWPAMPQGVDARQYWHVVMNRSGQGTGRYDSERPVQG